MKTGLRAWTGQRAKDIALRGKKNATWIVYWNDPDGKRRSKSCGPGREGWRLAEKERQRLHGELVTGTYEDAKGGAWADFRVEYEAKILSGKDAGTRRCTVQAVKHFERIVKPARLTSIRTQTIDDYIATRRRERGKKKGDTVSPATVNKELRHLKAVLRIANEWGYLPKLPKVRMLKEPRKLIRYVTGEHFAAIYKACKVATMPHGLPYPPADWWKALLTFTYMTGWRVGEPTALRREDLDLDAGTAITRHADNKGRSDERVPLHPVVVDHLRTIASFDRLVFPWPHHERTLWAHFAKIQDEAGIHLPCDGDHEHTDACHLYGFHDLRRAFATMNAGQLTGDALQSLMRHRSYQTTQRYINMAKQLDGAVEALHVPECLLAATGGE